MKKVLVLLGILFLTLPACADEKRDAVKDLYSQQNYNYNMTKTNNLQDLYSIQNNSQNTTQSIDIKEKQAIQNQKSSVKSLQAQRNYQALNRQMMPVSSTTQKGMYYTKNGNGSFNKMTPDQYRKSKRKNRFFR